MDHKYTKASVQYGHGHPGQQCKLCVHFIKGDGDENIGNRCEIVAGAIGANDWCNRFRKGKGK